MDLMLDGARVALRRHMANALFVVAAIEAAPPELRGAADAATVHFPWGSLLRGLVRAEEAVVVPIVSLLRPGGTLTAMLSVGAWDRDTGLEPLRLDDLRKAAARYRVHGLVAIACREATATEIAAMRSSWAKRLGAGRAREVFILRWRREVRI